MLIIPFSSLGKRDFHISSLMAHHQRWDIPTNIHGFTASPPGTDGTAGCYQTPGPRRMHGFLYFANCMGDFHCTDGYRLHVDPGTMVYLPLGVEYKLYFIHREEGAKPTTKLVNFMLHDENGDPFRLAPQVTAMPARHDSASLETLMDTIIELCSMPIPNIARSKSLLYRLLSEYDLSYRRRDIASHAFSSIAKGIAYIENDVQQALSIAEIAQICNVSDSTFRRLFTAYAGMSPTAFRINRKIKQAQRLLENDMYTVSEIADALGFADIGYFCRLFKKYTGVSPRKYQGNGLE